MAPRRGETRRRRFGSAWRSPAPPVRPCVRTLVHATESKRHYFVRDMVESFKIVVPYVSTHGNVSDFCQVLRVPRQDHERIGSPHR